MSKRNRPSVAVVTPTPVSHALVRSWTGGVGECGAECACGLIFDGFDTVAAARNELWEHYLDSIPHPAWCDRTWCGEGGGDLHGTPEQRIGLPDDGSVSAWLHQRHGDPADRGIMLSVDCTAGVAGLTVEQAVQLRDALDALIATATGNLTHLDEVIEAFRVGREIGEAAGFEVGVEVGQVGGQVARIRGAKNWAAVDRKAGSADAKGNTRRAPKSTDCKIPAQKRVTAAVGAA